MHLKLKYIIKVSQKGSCNRSYVKIIQEQREKSKLNFKNREHFTFSQFNSKRAFSFLSKRNSFSSEFIQQFSISTFKFPHGVMTKTYYIIIRPPFARQTNDGNSQIF